MIEMGNRLRALREKAKMSQQAIADEITKAVDATTQSSVNRYEKGKATPPTKTLLWYADFFDVSMDYIYNRTEKPEGKLYNYEPKILHERAKNEEDWNKFIEMCFDPNTDANARLKETLKNMMKEGKRK
jgi:transcriptional regulator with XRE-family HTH domain